LATDYYAGWPDHGWCKSDASARGLEAGLWHAIFPLHWRILVPGTEDRRCARTTLEITLMKFFRYGEVEEEGKS
jgi:hypothetical protein